MVWAGYLAITIAVMWLLLNCAAYGSAGGTIEVVVYDAVVYPPVIGVVGLYLVLSKNEINLALWIYLIIWAVTTGVAVGAIRLMEEIGDKPL